MKFRVTLVCAWLALTFAAVQAFAYDGIVEKKVFTLSDFVTFLGNKTIKEVRIGYETYGSPDNAKNDAILITHFFNGNSHAAGRYAGDNKRGYWDSIIGPNNVIDTDKYFVISADTLVNLNVHDGHTVTTGPATIDPATGKEYGMRFPVVTIQDFVEVQFALLKELKVKKLKAVMGASMGALQAFEWGAAHAKMVERIIPVAGMPETNAFGVETMNIWSMGVRLDPNWNHGDYYGGVEPITGLRQSVRIMTLGARAAGWGWKDDLRKPSPNQDPEQSLSGRFLIEEHAEENAAMRAAQIDANSLLYLSRAGQLFVAGRGPNVDDGLKQIKAKVLLISVSSDLLFPPAQIKALAKHMRDDLHNEKVYCFEIESGGGHYDAVAKIDKAADKLRQFLSDSWTETRGCDEPAR